MTKTRKNNKPIKGGNIGPIHSIIKYIIIFALKNLNDVEGHGNLFYNKLKQMDCYEGLVNEITEDLGNSEPIVELINSIFQKPSAKKIRDFVELILKEAGLYSKSLSDYILEDSVIPDRMNKIFNNKGLNRVKMLPPSIINQLAIENVDDLAGHFEDDKISPFSSSPRTMNSDSM